MPDAIRSDFAPSSASINPSPPLSVKDHQKYSRLWNDYGWNEIAAFDEIVTDHRDFFDFLRNSRLLYSIRGYQNSFSPTSNDPMKIGFFMDEHRRPCLYMQGAWVAWDEIKEEIEFNPTRKKIVSKDNPNREWNYLYPNGLTPEKLTHCTKPIFQLSADQMQQMKERVPGASDRKNCYFQIFSTEEGQLKKLSHIGLRLIDQTGRVYSFGYEHTEDILRDTGLFDAAQTYNAQIKKLDYKEFGAYETRRVTTKPLDTVQMHKALQKIRSYDNEPLRFNFAHQNCSSFVNDIGTEAGISLDNSSSLTAFLWEFAKEVPYLGPVIEVVDTIAKFIFAILKKITPDCLQKPIWFVVTVITYIPGKIVTVMRNALIAILGGTRAGEPSPPGANNTLDNRQRLTGFDHLISDWTDLFREGPGIIYSPYKTVQWQFDQGASTAIHVYSGSPSLAIVPPAVS